MILILMENDYNVHNSMKKIIILIYLHWSKFVTGGFSCVDEMVA